MLGAGGLRFAAFAYGETGGDRLIRKKSLEGSLSKNGRTILDRPPTPSHPLQGYCKVIPEIHS